MARRFRQLLVFLLLGASINYALAMGIIWFGPVGEPETDSFTFHGTSFWREDAPGMTIVLFLPYAWGGSSPEPGEPPAWSSIHRLPRPLVSEEEWLSLPDPPVHMDFAAGWPRRSLIYGYDYHPGRPRGPQMIIRSGIELPPRQVTRPWGTFDHNRAIPLRIIPAGFALNTLLFASLAAMMWHAPGTIRRIRRRRGNRCLKCGYPRAGLADEAACPECGTPSAAATEAV